MCASPSFVSVVYMLTIFFLGIFCILEATTERLLTTAMDSFAATKSEERSPTMTPPRTLQFMNGEALVTIQISSVTVRRVLAFDSSSPCSISYTSMAIYADSYIFFCHLFIIIFFRL